MRFVTFQRHEFTEPGVLRGNEIASLLGAGFVDLAAVIAGGAAARERVDRWLERVPPGDIVNANQAALRAPMARPPKIVCVGLNYRDHAIESKMEIPSVPTIFAKFATAVIGPGDPIVLPQQLRQARLRGRVRLRGRPPRTPRPRRLAGRTTFSATRS